MSTDTGIWTAAAVRDSDNKDSLAAAATVSAAAVDGCDIYKSYCSFHDFLRSFLYF